MDNAPWRINRKVLLALESRCPSHLSSPIFYIGLDMSFRLTSYARTLPGFSPTAANAISTSPSFVMSHPSLVGHPFQVGHYVKIVKKLIVVGALSRTDNPHITLKIEAKPSGRKTSPSSSHYFFCEPEAHARRATVSRNVLEPLSTFVAPSSRFADCLFSSRTPVRTLSSYF